MNMNTKEKVRNAVVFGAACFAAGTFHESGRIDSVLDAASEAISSDPGFSDLSQENREVVLGLDTTARSDFDTMLVENGFPGLW